MNYASSPKRFLKEILSYDIFIDTTSSKLENKMSELNQLLLNFDYKINFNEHDFYLSKSNSNAFNMINRWPDWDKKILNISGEKFSGKSHLANIFRLKSKAFLIRR